MKGIIILNCEKKSPLFSVTQILIDFNKAGYFDSFVIYDSKKVTNDIRYGSNYKEWMENKELIKKVQKQRSILSFMNKTKISFGELIHEAFSSNNLVIPVLIPAISINLTRKLITKTNCMDVIDNFSREEGSLKMTFTKDDGTSPVVLAKETGLNPRKIIGHLTASIQDICTSEMEKYMGLQYIQNTPSILKHIA
ncbi:hypothetical protein [Owenweeksia hongkongensis]|uniref:hypothetical protein n=1 Tax=Owenweeksia hongkongensis TaxID=253245 RepID=UPI003A8DD93C